MQYRSRRNTLGNTLTAPFIWLPLPFFIMLDLVIEFYQRICFPIYGIEIVDRRKNVLVRDRAKLQYLSGWEKLGCMYCGYANGILPFMVEVSARTEKYWCGIMHENKPGFEPQLHHTTKQFSKYGDEADLIAKYGGDKLLEKK